MWPFGGCRQRPTLITADSLGRLHKIIITQQWSELPPRHFHTTSDPGGNLRGHDQGQGSGEGPSDQPAHQPLLPLPPFLCVGSFYSPLLLSYFIFLIICLSRTLIFTSWARLSHPLTQGAWKRQNKKGNKKNQSGRSESPIEKADVSNQITYKRMEPVGRGRRFIRAIIRATSCPFRQSREVHVISCTC